MEGGPCSSVVGPLLPAAPAPAGVLTTPQLHYAVLAVNSAGVAPARAAAAHIDRLACGYAALLGASAAGAKDVPPLLVDCANGAPAAAQPVGRGRTALAGAATRR